MKSSVLRLSYFVDASKATFSQTEGGPSGNPSPDGTSAFTRYMKYGPSSKATLRASVKTPRHIVVREIQKEVASSHGFQVSDLIIQESRIKPIARARQEAVARLLLETDLSTSQIGKTMGYKDHSTVLYVGNLLYDGYIKFLSGIWAYTPIPKETLELIPRKGRRGGPANTEIGRRTRETERRKIAPAKLSDARVGSPRGRGKGFCEDARKRGEEEARQVALCTQTSVSRSARGKK